MEIHTHTEETYGAYALVCAFSSQMYTYLQFTKLFMFCELKSKFIVIAEAEDVPLTRVLVKLGLSLDKFE